jgi:hypothetical protein
MNNDLTLKQAAITVGVVAVSFALLGWLLHAQCNPHPSATQGKPDTVLVVQEQKPDTVFIPRGSIKTGKIPAHAPDSGQDSLVDTGNTALNNSGMDSCVVWQIDTSSHGLKLSVQISSKELPESKPVDLRALFAFQLPPDTQRSIIRVDTMKVSTPIYKDWRNYALLAFGALTVAVITGKIQIKH